MRKILVLILTFSTLIFSQNFLKVDSIDKKLIELTFNEEYKQVKNICDSLINMDKNNPKYYFHYFTSDALQIHERINLYPLNVRDSIRKVIVNQSITQLENALAILDKIEMTPTNSFYLASLHGYYSRYAGINGSWWTAFVHGTKANGMMEGIIKEFPQCYDAFLYPGVFEYYAARLDGLNGFFASILGVSGNRSEGLEKINFALKYSKLIYPQALLMLLEINTTMEDNPIMAIPYFEEFIKEYPKNKRVTNWYGHTLLNMNKANKIGLKIKNDKFGMVDNFVKAKYYFLTDEIDSAAKYAKYAFQKPNSWKGIIEHTKYYYVYTNWLQNNKKEIEIYKPKLDDFYKALFELDLTNEAESKYIYKLTTLLTNEEYTEFNKLILKHPKFVEKYFLAEFNLLQGTSLFQQNKLAESLPYFEKAVDSPDRRKKTTALRYLFDIYLAVKQPKEKMDKLIEQVNETDYKKLIFRLEDLTY